MTKRDLVDEIERIWCDLKDMEMAVDLAGDNLRRLMSPPFESKDYDSWFNRDGRLVATEADRRMACWTLADLAMRVERISGDLSRIVEEMQAAQRAQGEPVSVPST